MLLVLTFFFFCLNSPRPYDLLLNVEFTKKVRFTFQLFWKKKNPYFHYLCIHEQHEFFQIIWGFV